jgi:hypothetical protein
MVINIKKLCNFYSGNSFFDVKQQAAMRKFAIACGLTMIINEVVDVDI